MRRSARSVAPGTRAKVYALLESSSSFQGQIATLKLAHLRSSSSATFQVLRVLLLISVAFSPQAERVWGGGTAATPPARPHAERGVNLKIKSLCHYGDGLGVGVCISLKRRMMSSCLRAAL